MRNVAPSFNRQISKHVPSLPPSTGLPSYFRQPPLVSAGDDVAAATTAGCCVALSGFAGASATVVAGSLPVTRPIRSAAAI